MEYTKRYLELIHLFKFGVETHLESSNTDIRFYPFKSTVPVINEDKKIDIPEDSTINENLSFEYPVFIPSTKNRSNKAILLLHGLNERNWGKYLTWAEYLCQKTGKPVILFPIAFHVNRSPLSWTNPRNLIHQLDLRRHRNGADPNLSLANLTFSERISERPERFYKSGQQSLNDISQLSFEIKNGTHPLFFENTQIDIFAYSIGAFLAEIIMMTNPRNLFSTSKLFILCGGGIFSSMKGESRLIMDKEAYEKLFNYYQYHFVEETKSSDIHDKAFESFNSMISIERNKDEREHFFKKLGKRLKGISLVNDKVMPYNGVIEALGHKNTKKRIALVDFPFEYSHENPFPVSKSINSKKVDRSFSGIFDKAAKFLK